MKKALLVFFLLCFYFSENVSGAHFSGYSSQKNVPTLIEGNGAFTIKEFLALTPNSIKEKTGCRLTWKETIALKKAQKKIRKQLEDTSSSSSKNQSTALLLAVFLGFIGAHRFYLGYGTAGVFQLLTFGGCGIWSLIDMIMIATGDLQPIDGPYNETLD